MNHKPLNKIITFLIPGTVIFLFLIKNSLISVATNLPPCLFFSFYHQYCPSCGNTRSVIALLHGDLLTSLRYNVIPLLSVILLSLGYIEFAAYSFGKKIPIFPRKLSFYLCIISLLILYWIIRNFFPYLTP